MTIAIDKVLAQFGDRYDRNARLAPALLVLLPAVIAIIALYGNSLGILGTVVSTIGLCGGWVMLADWARSRGKAKEQALWSRWGGPPSTQVLRYTDATFDDLSKSRYHKILQSKVGKPFPPSRDAEMANPAAADVLYTSACNWLRENTRDDKKYPLLKNDNIAYGFRRNGHALRWLGVAVASGCIGWILLRHGITSLLARLHLAGDVERMLSGGEWVSLAVGLIMLLAWLGFFTEGVVRTAAFSYAQKLVVACEHIGAPPSHRSASTSERATKKPRATKSTPRVLSETDRDATAPRRSRSKRVDGASG
ncbi:hypothetical protein [Paraburkholderia sp. DHOC27]|uniref:hypothetical protein n=1 Tax=Paraburkholderia sp. DHOC27 TaxID=2303330 RepID=UPI0015F2EE25|nr:hypothetical protein [Paraburkholderia sp. DHOC27]